MGIRDIEEALEYTTEVTIPDLVEQGEDVTALDQCLERMVTMITFARTNLKAPQMKLI